MNFLQQKTANSTWYHMSYTYEWVFVLVSQISVFALGGFISPFTRYIQEGDPMLSYPVVSNTIPAWALFIISFGIPVAFFAGFALFQRKDAHDFHNGLFGLMQSMLFMICFVNFGKLFAGRYRPNFFALEQEGNESSIRDGHLSYPSGHAAFSFLGMVFLTLYLMGKLKVFQKDCKYTTPKVILCLLPILVAFFVAISRTRDYHHNFSDINAGALIGTASAFTGYFLNFNSLSSKNCDLPCNRKQPHNTVEPENDYLIE